MKMNAVIATHGRPDLLDNTLKSLCQVRLPRGFERLYVIENGSDAGARDVCAGYAGRIPVVYYRIDETGKSRALQWAVEKIATGFIALFDDDIRLSEGVLDAYAAAVQAHGPKHVYGGPFDVDYEARPSQWLRAYLPPSAGGPMSGDPIKRAYEWGFLGFNYGVFAEDILSVGGFRLDIGPGANGTGQETELQMRLFRNGCAPVYVKDAMVWHYVPKERCTQKWAIQRNYRAHLGKILVAKELPAPPTRLLGLPLGRWKYTALLHTKLFLAEDLSFVIPNEQTRFRARYWASGMRGRLEGIRRNVMEASRE